MYKKNYLMMLPIFIITFLINLLFFHGVSHSATEPSGISVPDPKNFQIDLFTGASGANIPIAVMPGTGGLQPALSLSYSSGAVDDLAINQQPSWVGLGWSLAGSNNYIMKTGSDSYRLIFQGSSYDLVYNGTDSYWHTNPESYLRVKKESDYWSVKTKDGTTYRFGYSDASRLKEATSRAGTQKWSYLTENGVWSSPAVGLDGTIYVGGNDWYIYAINSNGTLKWRYQTGNYVDSSPAIGSDGTIYIGSDDNYLYALNSDGTLKWRYLTEAPISTSSPAIASDGTIYVGSLDGYLYAINTDGTLKWRYFTPAVIRSSPAIGPDGTIYVGGNDRYIYAINTDGTLKWRYLTGGGIYSSPAIAPDGSIYVGSHDNYLYAINSNGTLKWRYLTGDDVESSPAIAPDGSIYIGSDDNYLYALNSDGTLKWRYLIGSTVSSSPAIAPDGSIYIGSDGIYVGYNYYGYLYAINTDGTLKWRYQTGSSIDSSPAIAPDGSIYVGSWDNYLHAVFSTGFTSQSTTSRWYLDQVDDTDGNRMKINYTKYTDSTDSHEYSILPSKIEYSYNSSDTLIGNKREVIFNTSSRDDVNTIYKNKNGFWEDKKLDSIEVKINNLPVRKYVMTYDYSADYVTEDNFENPGFETGSTTGWNVWKDSTYHSIGVVAGGQSGSYSLKIQLDGYPGKAHAWQSVTIPRSASFLKYWVNVDPSYPESFHGLGVYLYDSGVGKEYMVDFIHTTNAAWQQRFVDLSRWAGKGFTLYFRAENKNGDIYGVGNLWLDNIYLGTPALTLKSVTQWGSDGTSYSGTLPATNFEYTQNRLSKVNNGIGGSISYTYETYIPHIEFTGFYANDQRRYRVLTRVLDNGMGQTSTYNYNYFNDLYHTGDQEFRGHGQVNATDPPGNVSKSYFYQDDTKKGMLYKSESYDNLSNLYARVESTISTKETKITIPDVDQLTNRGFESDITLGWTRTADGSGTAVRDNGVYHGGSYSAKMMAGGNGLSSGWVTLEQTRNLSSDVKYLSFWAKIPQNPVGGGFKVLLQDASGIYEIKDIYNDYDWSEYRADISYWAGVSNIKFIFQVFQDFNSSPEVIVFLDDISFISKTPLISFPYISQSLEYTYDGDASYKRRRTDFEYNDNYGNLTKVLDYGDDDVLDRYTQTDYVYNDSATMYIVNTPMLVAIKDSANTTLSQSRSYYDSLAYGASPTKGSLTKKEDWLNDTTWIATSFEYDSYGNQTKVTNPRGYSATTSYDTTYYTYPVTITNARSHTTTTTYDSLMRPITVTDPNNVKGETRYDVFGRATKSWTEYDTEGLPTVEYTYTLGGASGSSTSNYLMTKQREQSSTTNTLDSYTFFDGLGRMIQTKTEAEDTAKQIAVDTTYNSRGMVENVYIPYLVANSSGYTIPDLTRRKTTTEYDPLGRSIKVTNPDGTYNTASYQDWVVSARDEKFQQKKYYHDAYSRLTKIEEYTGTGTYTLYGTTDYEYDLLGRLKKIKDSAGTTDATRNITQLEYDNLGRKTRQIDPDMGTWTYEYDASGNLTFQTDAKNYKTKFAYDELNRLDYIMYDRTYNKVYRMSEVTGNGVVNIGDCLRIANYVSYPGNPTYALNDTQKWVADVTHNDVVNIGDALRCANFVSYPGNPAYDIADVKYTYDTGTNGIGRLSWIRNDFTKISYAYDKLGRMTSETRTFADPLETDIISHSYDAMGRLVNLTYPDGELVNHTYNAQGLLDKVSSTTYAMDYMNNINYNAFGQVAYKKYGSTKESNLSYRTDNFRLNSIAITGLQNLTFGYDNVGNITGITDTINAGTQSFGYDYLNRLTSASSTSTPTFSYAYDYNTIGNMTSGAGKTYSYPAAGSSRPHGPISDGTYTYDYDANGNLTSKTGSGNTYTYEYDYDNRPIKFLLNGSPQGQYWYNHAGSRVKKDESGTVTTYVGNIYKKTGTNVTKYYFANGERIAERDLSGNVYYYHPDHLGSSNVVTNSSGTQQKLTLFYPYGDTRTESGTKQIIHKYNDKELDGSGLYNYGARYYDPSIAHFTKADSIIPDVFDPQSLNRYAYARNNPTTMIDPTGESPCPADTSCVRTNPFGGPNINYDRPDRGPIYLLDINLFARFFRESYETLVRIVDLVAFDTRADLNREARSFNETHPGAKISTDAAITAFEYLSIYRATKFMDPLFKKGGTVAAKEIAPFAERLAGKRILGEPTSKVVSDAVANALQMGFMDPALQVIQRGEWNPYETGYAMLTTGISNPVTNLMREPTHLMSRMTGIQMNWRVDARIATFLSGSMIDLYTNIGRAGLFGGDIYSEKFWTGFALSRVAAGYTIFGLKAYDPGKELLNAKRMNKFLKSIFSVFGTGR